MEGVTDTDDWVDERRTKRIVGGHTRADGRWKGELADRWADGWADVRANVKEAEGRVVDGWVGGSAGSGRAGRQTDGRWEAAGRKDVQVDAERIVGGCSVTWTAYSGQVERDGI